jgi:ABC-type glycerol-3-phosphate transport system permease component
MDQRIEKPGMRSMNPWTVALVVAALVLVVLVIGGYTLNWTWTGFKGNTLWDWLHLLILPVVLTAVVECGFIGLVGWARPSPERRGGQAQDLPLTHESCFVHRLE